MKHQTIIEIVAAITMLFSAFFAAKNNKLTWTFSIISSVLYAWIFTTYSIYGQVLVQAIFVGQSITGIVKWSDKTYTIRRMDCFLFVLGLGLFLSFVPFIADFLGVENNPNLYMDSIALMLSLYATFLLSLKYIENWILWIVVNFLMINILYSNALYISSFLYVILLVNSIYGLVSWSKNK